ncbi:Uncharacterised protein [Mycolicibacterium vanbaalenii]|uniref:Uncharacterized protein n=1 Tax=Mycolicibacterium vanbaalenii TaxID=110539 RepID=A0A5S9RD32_MYCVN|nr:hypothetical protein [Mycolicibacterium vanbaalenii]CAA0138232.1 Uncharacterised protein [Mycolicibacterium vanbaalenii]
MITFEQARQIVADNRASAYPPEADFQVDTVGFENDTHYQLIAGPYAMGSVASVMRTISGG